MHSKTVFLALAAPAVSATWIIVAELPARSAAIVNHGCTYLYFYRLIIPALDMYPYTVSGVYKYGR